MKVIPDSFATILQCECAAAVNSAGCEMAIFLAVSSLWTRRHRDVY